MKKIINIVITVVILIGVFSFIPALVEKAQAESTLINLGYEAHRNYGQSQNTF